MQCELWNLTRYSDMIFCYIHRSQGWKLGSPDAIRWCDAMGQDDAMGLCDAV